MSTYYVRPEGGLDEIRVGEPLTINGQTRRVMAVTLHEAPEDDPALGVEAGDLVTTLELAPEEPLDT